MSRSGYCEDDDDNTHGLWRGAVASAIRGERGQFFLGELVAALDAMPVKELITGEVVNPEGQVCAIGSVALARGLDVTDLDIHDGNDVGEAFGVAPSLAREIAFQNDDDFAMRGNETPAQRWTRMRAWAAAQVSRADGGTDGK
jgi:hypothetical protein